MEREITPEEIKDYRKRKDLTQSELGNLCGVGKSSVAQWESGATKPSGASKLILEDLISGQRMLIPLSPLEERLLDELKDRRRCDTREELLKNLLLEEISKHPTTIPANVTPLSMVADGEAEYKTPRRSAHLQAAAGAPILADVIDWEGDGDTVLVKINGLSMVPLLNDGEVVPMRHRRASRSPFMKKGLIYLVAYDGGYTVKRYNTRPAKPEEAGEEWVENGRVKILESINPDYPEIVIKQELNWVAWLDDKK